jgi:AraC family transcriptional regulator, glycine betaine-responsive activator
VVIAGFGTAPYAKGPFIASLAKAGRRARAVGGIEAGTWLLGHAGLLDGHASTTHFEDMEDFRATFPESDVRPARFVIDGRLFTCGGASPALDLMLHIIRSRNGAALAMNVASVFLYEQARAATDPQPLVSLGQVEQVDKRVAAAIRLMEAHIDTPMAMATIARHAGVSARTLETAFRHLIGETPGHYYLGLRLAAARKMVTDTKLPLTEIAARTGFSSAAVFSRAFSHRFKRSATTLR